MYALKDSPLIPSDDEQADMYLCMVEELRHYGYEQYEISNFSIPGYESRHNLKYWQLDDYMASARAHTRASAARATAMCATLTAILRVSSTVRT